MATCFDYGLDACFGGTCGTPNYVCQEIEVDLFCCVYVAPTATPTNTPTVTPTNTPTATPKPQNPKTPKPHNYRLIINFEMKLLLLIALLALTNAQSSSF